MLNLKKLLTKLVSCGYTSGADRIWTYRKYVDHTYHAWCVANVALGAGTALGGGYFHPASSPLFTPPSFSTSITSLTGASAAAQLVTYMGCANDGTTYWWNGVATASSLVPVRMDMYGTW